MDTQKISTKQVMLNYGLVLGFISILFAVANYAFGDVYRPHWIISVIGPLASIILIVLGIKKVKDAQGGLLTFGQALKTGLGIALISGLVYIVYSFLFTSFIEPEFYTNMAQVQEQTIIEKYPTWSDEQIEASVEMAGKFNSPVMSSAFLLAGSLFFGFIISLIAGLIMKKSEEV